MTCVVLEIIQRKQDFCSKLYQPLLGASSKIVMPVIPFSLNKQIILNALTPNINHCEYQKDCESSRWRQINQSSFNHRRINNYDCYVSSLRESRLLHQVIINCSNFVFYLTHSCLLRSFASTLFSI